MELARNKSHKWSRSELRRSLVIEFSGGQHSVQSGQLANAVRERKTFFQGAKRSTSGRTEKENLDKGQVKLRGTYTGNFFFSFQNFIVNNSTKTKGYIYKTMAFSSYPLWFHCWPDYLKRNPKNQKKSWDVGEVLKNDDLLLREDSHSHILTRVWGWKCANNSNHIERNTATRGASPGCGSLGKCPSGTCFFFKKKIASSSEAQSELRNRKLPFLPQCWRSSGIHGLRGRKTIWQAETMWLS